MTVRLGLFALYKAISSPKLDVDDWKLAKARCKPVLLECRVMRNFIRFGFETLALMQRLKLTRIEGQFQLTRVPVFPFQK